MTRVHRLALIVGLQSCGPGCHRAAGRSPAWTVGAARAFGALRIIVVTIWHPTGASHAQTVDRNSSRAGS